MALSVGDAVSAAGQTLLEQSHEKIRLCLHHEDDFGGLEIRPCEACDSKQLCPAIGPFVLEGLGEEQGLEAQALEYKV